MSHRFQSRRVAILSSICFVVIILGLAFYYRSRPDSQLKSNDPANNWATDSSAEGSSLVKREGMAKIEPGVGYPGAVPPPFHLPPIRIQSSEPIEVNGARFTGVVTSDWILRQKGDPVERIYTQLLITNLTDTDLIFPTYDTWYIIIKTDRGADVSLGGSRDWSGFTPAIAIPKGATYCLDMRSMLEWSDKKAINYLITRDPSGTITHFPFAAGGTFTFSVNYANQPSIHDGTEVEKAGFPKSSTYWSGHVVTTPVEFKVHEAK
jgi:hypothetical protein